MIDQRSVNARISELEEEHAFLAQMVATALSGGGASREDFARLAEISTRGVVEPEVEEQPWERPSHDPDSDEPDDDLSTPARPS